MSLEAWSTVASMRETLESEKFVQARRFVSEQVPKLIADPAGRSQLGVELVLAALEAVKVVGNFFETMGVFKTWKQLEPVAMIRRKVRYSGTWASFEYLAVICEKSLAKRQGDYYPRGMPRMAIDKRSMDAAAAFDQDRAGVSERAR